MKEKPKVLLVNTNTEKSPYPVPPLGICMIASSLRERFEVRVYDGVFDEGRSLPALVEEFLPDFIGFGIRNVDDVVADRPVYYIEQIINDFIIPVKKITSVPLILGGSGFSMFPEEILEASGADYGIAGEGETIFPELLEKLIHGEKDIPAILRSRKRTAEIPLAEVDSFIDFEPYRQRGVYSIQTKRGCAHGCIYCSYPVIEGTTFRLRKPSDIADEIAGAAERLGDITFEFVDSTFNDPEGHAEAICREIIRRKLKVKLRTMGINPRHCSDGIFELMREAGFLQIDATPDTASPDMLISMHKGFDLSDIRKMAGMIRKTDIPTMWFFVFGGPGECARTVNETLSFIDDYVNPADLVYLNYGLRIYPGTPLYQIAIKEGKVKKEESILYPPPFYFPDEPLKTSIREMIMNAASSRHNCIPSTETKPSPEMLKEAVMLREKEGSNEVMFRTLLRVRKAWKEAGKL